MPITLTKPAQSNDNSAVADLPPKLEPLPERGLAVGWGLFEAVLLLGMFLVARTQGVDPGAWTSHPLTAALGAALVVTALALGKLYDPMHAAQGWLQVGRILRVWAIVVGATLALALMARGPSIHLAPMLLVSIGILMLAVLRLAALRPWLRHRYGRSLRGARIIVGTGDLARRMATAAAESKAWGPDLVGFVDDLDELTLLTQRPLQELPGPYLGGLDEVRTLARDGRISHVLVAREDLSRGRLVALAHHWMGENLKVSLVSSAFEVMVARASASMLGGVPLAILKQSPQRGWRLKWKRVLDVSLVLLGGALLLPVLSLIAIAIKLTSEGPVLYKQKRVGRDGKPFTLYKFRSMRPDNDDRAHRRYVEAMIRGEPAGVGKKGEKIYKLVNDPRITPLGRFLRATSLDEFPQLYNVLKGDMSLVGPRPCLPYEWDLYEDWQRPRLKVLPGITGLWQVSGRSQVPFEEMVLLDLHYIANWSISLDIALLFRTVPVVLNGNGGH